MTVVDHSLDKARRDELSSFLRTRRERITPAEVGIAPGMRRRTPGLRREEVAQLAGVGVTWYTWLEQGRPINASVQVLDAVARVLRLGPAERWHLYRLADVPGIPNVSGSYQLPSDVPPVLDALEPNPACVYDGKYDLLACNESYAALFPGVVSGVGHEHNALWQSLTMDPDDLLTDCLISHMVATVRANYARHVGDPEWVDFIEHLAAVSCEFAELWATHEVAEPMPQVKTFACGKLGPVHIRTSSYGVTGAPDCRMVVYLPASPADAAKIETVRARSRLGRSA